MHVLVGYAGVHGSTAEVAAKVGAVLESAGLRVTVADVRSVADMQGYDACVLGSAVHSGELLPAMIGFFERFETALATLPVFLWLTCLRATERGGSDYAIRHYIPPSIAAQVDGCTVFAGRLDAHELSLNERWVLANLYDGEQKPERVCADFRDWSAIGAWAVELAGVLQTDFLHRSA